MSERVWHKGPPPHIGWWLTRDEGPLYNDLWRYWDGQQWSISCFKEEDGEDGNVPYSGCFGPIEWTDYWPENARVPRLDPTGGHWTFNVDGMEPKSLPKQIDIAWRDGRIDRWCGSRHWRWSLSGCTGDILAWRPAA